ncbi:MAG TPA: HAD hydrolase family protein [Candidatus Choladousia intestinigallinarum]|nr:HAD hydrolase family protein [Candidatus Choladousia intestinigallinarum]
MGLQKIKLAAFDLDDTLLLPGGSLSKRARTAIERACQGGIEIVPASGRAFSSLPEELLQMPQIHYAITSYNKFVTKKNKLQTHPFLVV